jgi:hypothetical protein
MNTVARIAIEVISDALDPRASGTASKINLFSVQQNSILHERSEKMKAEKEHESLKEDLATDQPDNCHIPQNEIVVD